MAWISWSRTWAQKCSSKNMRWNWMRVILHADQRPKQNQREPADSSTRTILVWERIWTDVEPGEFSISDYAVSKKLIHLRRHGRLHRENYGAIEFWRIKDNLQEHVLYCHHWSDDKWKKTIAGGGGNKKRYQYCTDSSGVILYLRALQGHSGRSLIDPTLLGNVVIPDGFFQYFYHVGCAISLHSIINSGLIPGGPKNWATDRQYSFCLWIPWTKTIRILTRSTWKHRVLHNTCTKHGRNIRTRYIVSTSTLALKKGLKFYQTRSNAIILHETLPSLLYPESCKDGNWRSHIRESICMSPRLPPKISLKHDWMKEFGSEVAQWPDEQVVQQFNKSSQLTQPNPNPDHDRTGPPVVGSDPRTAPDGRKTSRSQEIETRSFHEEAVKHDRTGTPVGGRDASHGPGNEQPMLNEVNVDFRILGLPHSVVRTTLTDMLFTRSLRRQSRWFRTWAT